jgi:hypothetical protein
LGQAFNISSNEGCTTITSQAKFFRIKLFVGNLLAQLAKSEAAIQVYKELDEIDARLRGKDYYNTEKSKALELKIDNLVQVGH